MQEQTIATETGTEQNSSYPEAALSELTADTDLIDQIARLGFEPLTKLQAQALPLILAGQDVVIQGPRRGRSLAFGIALAITTAKDDKSRTYVMTDSEGDAERLCRGLQDLGVSAAKVGGGKQKGGKNGITNALVLVGTTQGMLDAFDAGVIDGSRVTRAILDGTEGAISSGRMEELLNLLHDLSRTQIILVRNETSMNIVNFIKKFLKSPAEVKIGESKEDHASEDRPDREASEPAPRQSRNNRRNDEALRDEASAEELPVAPAATPPKVKKAPANAKHLYFELSGELLAKPNALTDLIEGSGLPKTVVFCNSPSEADLTDVMLRKRGITSRKLIGFVPQAKIASALSALENNEVTALVLTDISAREIQLPGLGLVVNYSIHSDPEVYLQRAAVAEEGPNAISVVSLITPLDLANFHSLRKLMGVDFTKAEPPSKEDALKARVVALSARAVEKGYSKNERVAALLPLILADPQREEIIALLTYNTFEALPAALAAAQADRGRDAGREGDDEGRSDRRDDRGDRRGRNRRDRRDRNFDDRRDEGEGAEAGSHSLESDSPAEGNRERRDRRGRRGEGRGEEGERAPYVPPAKDLRLYVGHGTKDGFDTSRISELVISKAEITADQIKRTICRDHYCFVDVPEGLAESVVSKMSEAELPGGGKIFIRKAVTISAPREEKGQQDDDTGRPEVTEVSSGESAVVTAQQ